MKKSIAVASGIALIGMALSSGVMYADGGVLNTPDATVYGAQSQNTRVYSAPSAAGEAYSGGYARGWGGEQHNRDHGNERRRGEGNRNHNGGGHHHTRR